jgi:hypothetical protein
MGVASALMISNPIALAFGVTAGVLSLSISAGSYYYNRRYE